MKLVKTFRFTLYTIILYLNTWAFLCVCIADSETLSVTALTQKHINIAVYLCENITTNFHANEANAQIACVNEIN